MLRSNICRTKASGLRKGLLLALVRDLNEIVLTLLEKDLGCSFKWKRRGNIRKRLRDSRVKQWSKISMI